MANSKKKKVIILNVTRSCASDKLTHFHDIRKDIDANRVLNDKYFLSRVLETESRVLESCWSLKRILRADVLGLVRYGKLSITIKL